MLNKTCQLITLYPVTSRWTLHSKIIHAGDHSVIVSRLKYCWGWAWRCLLCSTKMRPDNTETCVHTISTILVSWHCPFKYIFQLISCSTYMEYEPFYNNYFMKLRCFSCELAKTHPSCNGGEGLYCRQFNSWSSYWAQSSSPGKGVRGQWNLKRQQHEIFQLCL